MPENISAVINTFNEERNIKRAIESVKWATEIIVCDMYSDDETVKIAKSLGAKVITHKRTGFVEPARNFAITKASGDWILILDADEIIPPDLAERLKEIAKKLKQISYVEIPRKNIIFGKELKATGWYPDYQVRFFKKGEVTWKNEIHSRPELKGEGLKLEGDNLSIIHQNYQSIFQFIERMNRYTDIQVEELKKSGYKFKWQDLFQKPLEEFLSRFFANKGYEDGLHGLALSFLQAASFLVLYLKLWEMEGFREESIGVSDFEEEGKKVGELLKYWVNEKSKKGLFSKIFKK